MSDKFIKKFDMRQLKEAISYAADGGQALHVHTLNSGHFLFRRYPVIGHLFDQDRERLVYLAGRLGVRVIKVERGGTPKQHIDLCGKTFERAVELCDALLSTRIHYVVDLHRSLCGSGWLHASTDKSQITCSECLRLLDSSVSGMAGAGL